MKDQKANVACPRCKSIARAIQVTEYGHLMQCTYCGVEWQDECAIEIKFESGVFPAIQHDVAAQNAEFNAVE